MKTKTKKTEKGFLNFSSAVRFVIKNQKVYIFDVPLEDFKRLKKEFPLNFREVTNDSTTKWLKFDKVVLFRRDKI